MFTSGSLVGGRFRVLRSVAPAPCSVVLAEALSGTGQHWLVEIPIRVSEARLSEALERHGRFALGVPGLVRPVASGVEAGAAFLAFSAPASGSIAHAHTAAWPVDRVAALATRIAAALGPLHDQGIAYGCLLPELVAESAPGVLFGFGVAAMATAFGAAGEASQLVPPAYRAPELRAALVPPTPASDLFAFAELVRALLAAPERAGAEPPLPAELEAQLSSAQAGDWRLRPDVRAFAAQLAALAQRALAPVPRVGSSLATEVDPALDVAPVPEPDVHRGLEQSALPGPPAVPLPHPAPHWDAFREPVFDPPSAASTRRSGLIAWIAVAAGLLLMLGAVAGATVYVTRVSARALATARAAAAAAPSPPALAPAPRPVPPVPPSAEAPPLAVPEPELALDAPEKRAPRRHAPMVPPGVGLSSFPEEARVALPIVGNEPIWGTRHAALTWVFFGDLECPYTRRAWRALESVKASYGDDLRIVFRHRPLREHPYAENAARVLAGLARSKGSQAFFDVLHRVMQGDDGLTDERLTAELAAAGFADSPLGELAHAGEATVSADLQLAGQFALRSSPFSFLNGQAVDGERSFQEVQQLLAQEERSAIWLTAAGVPASSLYGTRTASNLIGVGDPVQARVCVPLATAPTRGPADALVTLVEFADFECPYCRNAEPTLKALLARYPKTLRVVWKDFPLPQHENALLLANFAAEAQLRGGNAEFWAVHDGLFALTDAPDDRALGALAGKAGLDGALLLASAHRGVHDAEIRSQLSFAKKLGVSGTPTFFANGRRIEGALPLARFDALIREELTTAQRIIARGTSAKDVYRLGCD